MNEQPICTQKAPYVKEEQPGRKWWCQCGRSKNQPYCDGSHKGTSIGPIMVEFTAVQKVAWCGCRHTEKKPYCDGAHSRI